jgi:signal transduction histidine kinase
MAYLYLIPGIIIVALAFAWYRDRRSANARLDDLEDALHRKTRELTDQIEKTEKSEKYKEFFLANMSHEIRTPMHAISGMSNILRRNEHLPGQVKYLDAIHQSAENLLVILNDILDSSKIEAGKLKIDEVPMEPAKIITDLVEILSLRAGDKGLALSYEIEAGLPERVIGDPIRLNQILTNLTSNAIKFTEQGSVRIICRKVTVDGNEMLQYSVKDSGIGIPENKMETIFEVFEQVDGTLSKKFGGTGLGLSICKQLV